MRKVKLETGKFYHIYNRGVDKRDIFLDEGDYGRFLKSLVEFNRLDPIGSLVDLEDRLYSESNSLMITQKVAGENLREGIGFQTPVAPQRLVDVICYCLNSNHFHLIFRQLQDVGISKLMHKLGVGYTNYFNLKYQRSGSLFQGKFKSVPIDSEEHLLWVAAYVNGNAQIHGLIADAANYQWCSYSEYLGKTDLNICAKSEIFGKFKDIDSFQKAYKECIMKMKERKNLQKNLVD